MKAKLDAFLSRIKRKMEIVRIFGLRAGWSRESTSVGFSLLESLVALSIIMLLVLIGASFGLDSKKHQLEVAVEKVNSGLSLARFKAIHHQKPVKVRFSDYGYDLLEYDDNSSDWAKLSSILIEGVKIEANNSPVFYPQGTVSNLSTIKIGNERGLYSITIAITGRTKITRLE